jgi:hypothetical protein
MVAPLASGVTIQNQAQGLPFWTVPGTVYGGFPGPNVTVPCGGVPGGPVPTSFSAGTTTFVWVDLGTSERTVTLSLVLSGGNGQAVSSSAVFTVEGPTSPAVAVTPGTVGVLSPPNNPQWLSLGCALTYCPNGFGMKFQASVNPPPDFSGSFMFLQIVTNHLAVLYAPAGSNPCPILDNGTCQTRNTNVGLDTIYPYPMQPGQTNQTNDSPGLRLDPQYIQESKIESFQMYLFWIPNVVPSVPVALGYVPWDYSSDAVKVNGAWSLNGNSTVVNSAGKANAPNPGSFEVGSSYPSWATQLPMSRAVAQQYGCGGN